MDLRLKEIWRRVLAGDAEAWDELVDAYATLVHSVARRNGLDEADAADCAQQTWLALYNSRDRIKGWDSLPGWLAGTAYRRAMRIVRRRDVQVRAEQKADRVEPPISPDEHVMLLQRRALLRHGLAKLDERCRVLLTALFFSSDDTSYREIARRLKVPMNSLGPTRRRCLEKLKKILEDLGPL